MFSCVVGTPLSQVLSPKGAVLILDLKKWIGNRLGCAGSHHVCNKPWNMAAASHWRTFAPLCLVTEPSPLPLQHFAAYKEGNQTGRKTNKTIQHSHKMPRTICFCFKSVPKAHSTLGAPVFIYLHFFPDLNYLCKQKKRSWGIMRRRSASEY